MRFVGSKYHTHAFAAGALPWVLLGELTVLPQTLQVIVEGEKSNGVGR